MPSIALFLLSTFFLSLSLSSCQNNLQKHTIQAEGYVYSSDSERIHYISAGQGDVTLLFIHCWSCNSTFWNAQLSYFSKKYQVIALDLAGHGASGASRKNYSIAKFADDVSAVVNDLKLNNVILIGHSMGGAVAVEAALILPEKVRGVVAVDAFATGYPWPEKAAIAAQLAPFQENYSNATFKMVEGMFAPHTGKALIYRIANDMASADPAVAISALQNLFLWMADEYPQRRTELKVPLININARRRKQRPAGDKNIITVPFVGHFIPLEAPLKFNQALADAIAIIRPPVKAK